MNIKKVFLFSSLVLCAQSAYTVRLVKIVNDSPESVFFNYLTKNFTLHSGNTKNLLVEFPFTSRQKNLVDFIVDKPYIPTDVMEILTLDGTFYLWRDERGIIVAKAFARGMTRQEALPAVSLPLSQQELNRVVGCIVTINDAGLLSIKKSTL